MKQAPKAIIEDGKVVNHAELERYWADYHFRRDRMRRSMFQDLRDAEPLVTKPQEIVHIVQYSNMGKQEFDTLQQLSREVTYLRNEVKELSKKKKGNKFTIRP